MRCRKFCEGLVVVAIIALNGSIFADSKPLLSCNEIISSQKSVTFKCTYHTSASGDSATVEKYDVYSPYAVQWKDSSGETIYACSGNSPDSKAHYFFKRSNIFLQPKIIVFTNINPNDPPVCS